MPDWAKKGADHTDEIAFVWGTVVAKNEYSKLAKGRQYILSIVGRHERSE